MKKFFMIVSLVMGMVMLSGCTSLLVNQDGRKAVETEKPSPVIQEPVKQEEPVNKEEPKTEPNGENPVVTITMENGSQIKIELYPDVAPNTVNNFISLVKSGFYNGLIFHRVIPDFMIQGGCPDGNGMGGPGYNIKGEMSNNGFENNLGHERGVISMARARSYDSAGSQFFITVKDSNFLDHEYAAFGRVIEGMDEVDRIVAVPRDGADKPYEAQIMKEVTVELFGKDYPEPVKM